VARADQQGRADRHRARLAKKAVEEVQPVPVFKEQRKIIELLHSLKVEVFIVTASIQWAVAPGAYLFDIPEDHVLGIETEVVNGLVTEKQKGALTLSGGQSSRRCSIEQAEFRPYFCAGIPEGDQFFTRGRYCASDGGCCG